ncbi:MAG: selenide, water dikinase SelD [bacterium]
MQGSKHSVAPAVRDLVLLGGGHAHVSVLKKFAMKPESGVRLTLISRHPQTPYSGMLPGCIAGAYVPEDIHINLGPLCQFANARLICAEVIGVDPILQRVQLHDRPPLQYDLLSINTGAVPAAPYADAVTVKPISTFLPKWHDIQSTIQPGDHLAIVGAGAGGVELAFAARKALPEAVKISLCGPVLLAGHNAKTIATTEQALAQQGITWLAERVEGHNDTQLQLTSGTALNATHTLWVTHVEAPEWIRQAGFDTDAAGFLSVDTHLQSTSHTGVFAAGDVACLRDQPRPKAGVYAVRAGAVLADNLRRSLTEKPLRTYRAQTKYLALLGDGQGKAIANRGDWSAYGRIWWLLKDRIDRNFMRKFNKLPPIPSNEFKISRALQADLPEAQMRCGGCGAKLAADPLRRVLARLPRQNSSHVKLGIGDDAALLRSPGTDTLVTIDGFRAMLDDPYLFGRIAAHHSLNDIFAMAAMPTSALAFITLPLMSEALMEEELFQVLSGAVAVLNQHNVPLVGGHTAEGAELTLALTVTGAPGSRTVTKSAARPGDVLILTKPLGTGVVLAASKQGNAAVQCLNDTLVSMDMSNAAAVGTFLDHDVHALTDITGFGLAGHLSEILRASEVGVVLELDAVPALTGAVELIGQLHSSLQSANELALADYQLSAGRQGAAPEIKLLADPQTSGGLLACVPQAQAADCLQKLVGQGYPAACIGHIVESGAWTIR